MVPRVHTGIPESEMKDPRMPLSIPSVERTVASEIGLFFSSHHPEGTALAIPMTFSLLLPWPSQLSGSHLSGPLLHLCPIMVLGRVRRFCYKLF